MTTRATQKLRVMHLYRKSLKDLFSWTGNRELFYEEVRKDEDGGRKKETETGTHTHHGPKAPPNRERRLMPRGTRARERFCEQVDKIRDMFEANRNVVRLYDAWIRKPRRTWTKARCVGENRWNASFPSQRADRRANARSVPDRSQLDRRIDRKGRKEAASGQTPRPVHRSLLRRREQIRSESSGSTRNATGVRLRKGNTAVDAPGANRRPAERHRPAIIPSWWGGLECNVHHLDVPLHELRSTCTSYFSRTSFPSWFSFHTDPSA